MRCSLSAARALDANAIESRATVASRRNMTKLPKAGSRLDQRITVFSKEQNLRDADLDRRRGGDEFRPVAGVALQRIDGIDADVDARALGYHAFDPFAVTILRTQQLDAPAERP